MHAGHTKLLTQDYKVSNWPQLSSEAYRTKCPIFSLLVCIAHFATKLTETMLQRIHFYSQLAISLSRCADIDNSNCRYQQLWRIVDITGDINNSN